MNNRLKAWSISAIKLAGIILFVMALYRYLGFLGIWLAVAITFGFAGFIIWKRWDLYKTFCLYGAKQLDKVVSRGEVFGRGKTTGRGKSGRTAGRTTNTTSGRSTGHSCAGSFAESAKRDRRKHGEP